MKKKVVEVIMGMWMLVLVAAVTDQYILGRDEGQRAVSAVAEDSDSVYCVVLDAGHGGRDPGKIGVNQAEEKGINLAIVYYLKQYLEASNVKVILTREDDDALGDTTASNKKMADMKARCDIINGSRADLVVSIHQNSYHEEAVKGPQVFYYKASAQGKTAAELLQAQLNQVEEVESRQRLAKSNDNYYLLLHTEVPIVICECGFLSNWQESELLVTQEYQQKIAWSVHIGIMQYLNQNGNKAGNQFGNTAGAS